MRQRVWFLVVAGLVGFIAAIAAGQAQGNLRTIKLSGDCALGFKPVPPLAPSEDKDYECVGIKPVCKSDPYRIAQAKWDGTQFRYTCQAPKP